ncbi:MAG: hypothetical protein Q8L48_12815 [Archangium sp.]|nr:hypothetical protein [Archangium sp.]
MRLHRRRACLAGVVFGLMSCAKSKASEAPDASALLGAIAYDAEQLRRLEAELADASADSTEPSELTLDLRRRARPGREALFLGTLLEPPRMPEAKDRGKQAWRLHGDSRWLLSLRIDELQSDAGPFRPGSREAFLIHTPTNCSVAIRPRTRRIGFASAGKPPAMGAFASTGSSSTTERRPNDAPQDEEGRPPEWPPLPHRRPGFSSPQGVSEISLTDTMPRVACLFSRSR